MGTDKTNRSEWQSVDIHPDSSGEDLWNAVEKGRLWLNIISLEKHSKDYAELVRGMYRHLDQHCPHLGDLVASYTTMLISSPGAQVYYHMDESPNMLWHISGQKRLWVYPAMDLRFVPQDFLEEIYTGEIAEFLPYDPSFDEAAESFFTHTWQSRFLAAQCAPSHRKPDYECLTDYKFFEPLLNSVARWCSRRIATLCAT